MSSVVKIEDLKHKECGLNSNGYPLTDISVGSRFHAFDLARELNSRRMLHGLYTGYPAFAAERFGLPRDLFNSVWTHEPLNRSVNYLHRKGLIQNRRDFILSDRFDRIVSKRLKPGANIFIGWSSQCLRSLQKAASYGMTTIVERGSAHIEHQREILLEEAELTGLPVEAPDPRTVERELAEYEQADFIAVPSRFVAETFIARGIARKRLLINPYGVDLKLFNGERIVGNRRSLRVIHVGRVSVQKGVHYLASAVERVGLAALTFVGAVDPGMEKIIRRPNTQIIGAVPGTSLPSFYSQADVFCLLSLQEGLALVIAQAMAMGLPIVATPNTGAEDLIEDGVEGFIVPARDPAAAAERLQWLAENEEQRIEMGMRAKAKVARGFSWADYGTRAVNIYRRLVQWDY